MVEIWLDTIHEESIVEATKCGLLFGITTNPAILSSASCVKKTLKRLLDIQEGPVAVQVTARDVKNMVNEALNLKQFSERIIVKIPLTVSGFQTIAALKKEKITIMGTAVLSLSQAVCALSLPIDYVALYFSRLGDASTSLATLERMRKVFDAKKHPPKILVASIKQVSHLLDSTLLGADAITIKPELFRELVADSKEVQSSLESFETSWLRSYGSLQLSDML